jgi:AcrR family transcriptional regulator
MARNRLTDLGSDEAIRDAILHTARALVRRYGVAKVTVLDVAHALGTSHTSLYRHFSSKAGLMDELGTEAMKEDEALAAAKVAEGGSAAGRLEALALEIHRRKCDRFRNDAEVHALYERVARDRPDLVQAYAVRMTEALAAMIAQGVAAGEFDSALDVATSAGVLRDALAAFVHPVLVSASGGTPTEERVIAVVRTLVKSFRSSSEMPRQIGCERGSNDGSGCGWHLSLDRQRST